MRGSLARLDSLLREEQHMLVVLEEVGRQASHGQELDVAGELLRKRLGHGRQVKREVSSGRHVRLVAVEVLQSAGMVRYVCGQSPRKRRTVFGP